MKLSLPTVSMKQSVKDIAAAIESSSLDSHGLLVVEDLPAAPLQTTLPTLMDHLAAHKDSGDRLNKAYTNNLVYKDSYSDGKGGPTVDRKRVLDLSPERLEAIRQVDPDLVPSNAILNETLEFWEHLSTVSNKIAQALAAAIGSDEMLNDFNYNYRMVDYYPHKDCDYESPRCGEHRDFGAFTLIYTDQMGLQIQDKDSGEWMDVPVLPNKTTSAILLFGWCTQIRSNGRIPACLHRVVDDDSTIRRTSAVLFTAPKHCDTVLTPVVRPGEQPLYISGVQVGQLRGNMARKWQMREGTLSEENAILEEEEIRATKRKTQDDVVRDMVMAAN